MQRLTSRACTLKRVHVCAPTHAHARAGALAPTKGFVEALLVPPQSSGCSTHTRRAAPLACLQPVRLTAPSLLTSTCCPTASLTPARSRMTALSPAAASSSWGLSTGGYFSCKRQRQCGAGGCVCVECAQHTGALPHQGALPHARAPKVWWGARHRCSHTTRRAPQKELAGPKRVPPKFPPPTRPHMLTHSHGTHTHMDTHIHTQVHMLTQHTPTHTHIHTHTETRTDTHTHTNTHAYIHTLTCTHARAPKTHVHTRAHDARMLTHTSQALHMPGEPSGGLWRPQGSRTAPA